MTTRSTVPTKYTNGVSYARIVHAGMISYPIAQWAYIVLRDSTLTQTYGKQAERYLHATEEVVAAYESSWRSGPRNGEGYYYGDYISRPLPFNQKNALGRTIVTLCFMTGNERYRDRAEAFARYFLHDIRNENGVYIRRKGTEIGDVSHTAINADLAYSCFEADIVFTRKDMQGFERMLRRHLNEAERKTEALSPQLGRWARLARFDRSLRYDLFEFMGERWTADKTTGLLSATYFSK